jgi:hypothetical protein
MKNKLISQISELLQELDSSINDDQSIEFIKNYDALELPDMLVDISSHLQPFLEPYEAAFYWYMFINSVVKYGRQEVRVSVRGMQEGVIHSSSGQSVALSYASVSNTLKSLESKFCILRIGETSRDGTPYKVCLPEEIPLVQESKIKDLPSDSDSHSVKSDNIDYYNIKENRIKVFERDQYKCVYCNKQLTRITATLDHIEPVSLGGNNSIDNLKTACLHCNSRRGNREVSDFIPRVQGNP